MDRFFPTCLLLQDGSDTPELEITENPKGGSRFLSDKKKTNVLLAGGFSSVLPKSGFPLSPTLQINHDLTTLGREDLAAIAGAEFTRSNAVDYRSYTLEVDKRVCVISDSFEKVDKFLDTYGGVLEIESLLVKGYHPEIETVTELKIENQGQKCRLEYQVRSPINLELCSYCGDCGPSCPEQCISETLFVNYDVCTLCRECEKACTAGAIDVHTVLDKVLEVPAIIVLGSFKIEVPAGVENVFYEPDLTDYFSTLFPSQIDEVITSNNALCQYSGKLGSGCHLCLSSCPHGAIVQDIGGVTVDAFKCQECGACVSACPTGALQNQRFNDAAFVDYFREVTIPKDGTIIVGGEESLHALWWREKGQSFENTLFLQYDPVSSLSLFHFIFLASRGARRIVLLEGDAENLTRNQAQHESEHQALQPGSYAHKKQLGLANEIIAGLFGGETVVSSCRLTDLASLMEIPPAGSFGPARGNGVFVNRRQSFAIALESLVKNSGKDFTLELEGSTKGVLPFGSVSCDIELCTHCMACLGDCRIEALWANTELLTLNLLASMCVGCGLCVHICPENALSLSSEIALTNDFFQPVELAKAEAMACKKCGKVFGTKKSYDRVMAILSQKETVDTSHFEYCDTCRVVKLFEAE